MPPSDRPTRTVLFILDGTPDEAHRATFADAGFNVLTTDRHKAVADAAAFQPDAIVLDFGSNGEITRQLKADRATKHIPVVALVDVLGQRGPLGTGGCRNGRIFLVR